jgi:hypothetical protein
VRSGWGDFHGEASISTDALAPLASLPISDLQLCNLPWRPGGVAALRSLTALRLTQTVVRSVADTGLSTIGDLPRLAQLDVAAEVLHQGDLAHVGKLSGLVRLNLSVSQLGNDGSVSWAGLTRLRDVRLASLRIADERLAFLADLPALESLTLPGVDFRRPGIDVVCSLHGLRTLMLDGANLVDIQPLFALGRLEKLSLSRIENPAVDLQGIGALPALRSLTLEQIPSPIDNIEPLRDVPQLQELHLSEISSRAGHRCWESLPICRCCPWMAVRSRTRTQLRSAGSTTCGLSPSVAMSSVTLRSRRSQHSTIFTTSICR